MIHAVALTVVAPATRRTADVLLEADPATPMADIAAELALHRRGGEHGPAHARLRRWPSRGRGCFGFPAWPHAHGPLALSSPLPGAEPLSVPLYVNRRQIPPQLSLAEARIGDGAVVSLGDPDGCLSPEQAGLVEVRVMGGPVRRRDLPARSRPLRISAAAMGRRPPRRSVSPGRGAEDLRRRPGPLPGRSVRGRRGRASTATRSRRPAVAARARPLAVGSSLLGLAPYEPPDAALRPSPDGCGA